jgi:DNA (cytosine-5)-methyltransferase 1
MKVLNLYAGIGGNRKLWENVEVTAVEVEPSIAEMYKQFFPQDKVIVGDAHQYLLEYFREFDFIWSSPCCQTHSRMRKNIACAVEPGRGRNATPVYPDMRLYQEIIFLQHYFKGKWVVENVISYYEPLIKPVKIQRHYFWANFTIPEITIEADHIRGRNIPECEEALGFDLSSFKSPSKRGPDRRRDVEKDKLLKNCVAPALGKHVFDSAFRAVPLLNYYSSVSNNKEEGKC